MKKYTFLFAIAMVIGLTSCGNGSGTATTGSDSTAVDSTAVVTDSTSTDSTVTVDPAAPGVSPTTLAPSAK